MSLGMFNRGSAPPMPQQQQFNLAAAEQELEMLTDMFNKIVDRCHSKCIPNNYADGELTKGESVCIDRCVAKFFQVNLMVSDKLTQKTGM